MSDRKVFRNLTKAEDAWNVLLEHSSKINRVESVPLIDAIDRVLSEDIFAPINVPPFDRVSIDGFAVFASDIENAGEDNPIELQLVGEVKAGYVYEGTAKHGTCVETSTGAPMPIGYDSVVMVEYTEYGENNKSVKIYRPTTPGENIASAGTDINRGERIQTKYTHLTSRELSVLASMGITHVNVFERPKVAIFSSGDEVIPPGDELKPGKIFDINTTTLYHNIKENGGEPYILGILPDNFNVLKTELARTINKYDLVIISGGTSAGIGDMIYRVVDELGKPGLLVHGIKVKPGKPTILARCDNTTVIGLPGFPTSALSITKLFVIPYLRYIGNLPENKEQLEIEATVKQRIRSDPGRHEFKPMNLVQNNGEWIAFLVPGGSGAITSLGMADGFLEIPDGVAFIEANTRVKIKKLSSSITPVDLQIIAPNCDALSHLLSLMNEKHPNIRTRYIFMSSNGGKSALRHGEAHICGFSSYDRDNTEIGVIIPGYKRTIGLILPKGNPKNIKSLNDLTKNNVRFIPFSNSTKKALMQELSKLNIKSEKINGYDSFVKSPVSAINAIRMNFADVTFGYQFMVNEEFDFIPVCDEVYYFMYNENNSERIKPFIQTLESKEFLKLLNNLPGYSKL